MSTVSKLAPVQGKNESKRPVTEMRDLAKLAGSPLTPELKGFIDRVIVPILVRDYLSGIARKNRLHMLAKAHGRRERLRRG